MTKPRDVAKQMEVKRTLIEKYGHKCEYCAAHGIIYEDTLDLHHVDWNRDNNTEDNCCILCPNCHSRIPNTRKPNRYTRIIKTEELLDIIKARKN